MAASTTSSARAPPDPIFVFRAHTTAVQTVAFHPTLPLLFSGSSDGELRVWDINTKRCIHLVSPDAHERQQVVKVEPFGDNKLLSQTRDGTLAVWDLISTARVCSVNKQHSLRTLSDSFCKFATLPTQGEDRLPLVALPADDPAQINLWDLRTDSVARVVTDASTKGERSGLCMSLRFARIPRGVAPSPTLEDRLPDSKALEITPDAEPTKPVSFLTSALRESSATAGVGSFSTPSNSDSLSSALFSAEDVLLASYESGRMHSWELRASTDLGKLKLHTEPALCLDFDNESGYGVSGGADSTLSVFRFPVQNEGAQLVSDISLPQHGIADVRIRSDKKIFATAGWDHKVRVFSWKKHRPLAILKEHTKTVQALAFCPHNPSLLATAGDDARIALYSIY